MNAKERYQMRKENGLCPRCGKNRNNNGKYCTDCQTYYRERRKELLAMKICPQCGREKLYGNEKACLDCTLRRIKKDEKKRKEHREEIRQFNKEYYHRKHEERIANGLCTRCGKKKGDDGRKMCPMCRYKKLNYIHERIANNE